MKLQSRDLNCSRFPAEPQHVSPNKYTAISREQELITLQILLEEILRLRESPSEETKAFTWKHERLCDVINRKINILGESFLKYHHINYIVQGPRDQGVDILLKLREDDQPEKYIGIQVKSYYEIDDKKNDLSKNLKSGYFDAKSHYGDSLERYYILLCGDSEKHKNRISSINTEFSKIQDTRVISPRYLHAFTTASDSTISALIDRRLNSEDYVRAQAFIESQEYANPELLLLLACLTWAFERGTNNLPPDFLCRDTNIMSISLAYGENSINRAFNRLADRAVEVDATNGTLRVRSEDYPAIQAIYYDMKVRYNEAPSGIFRHLFDFLRIE